VRTLDSLSLSQKNSFGVVHVWLKPGASAGDVKVGAEGKRA